MDDYYTARMDGDMIVYSAGYTAGDDSPASHATNIANSIIRRQIMELRTYLNVRQIKVYLTSTDKSNFRFDVATLQEYKGNRKDKEKPKHYDAVRQHLIDRYRAEVVHGQEADDLMMIHHLRTLPNSIIVSGDKDLGLAPGLVWTGKEGTLPEYSDELGYLKLVKKRNGNYPNGSPRTKATLSGRGLKFFYAQLLIGDTADHIPSIVQIGKLLGHDDVPTFGHMKAYDLLKDCTSESELLDKVRTVYYEYGYGDDVLREMGRLTWIRRLPEEMWDIPNECM